MTLVVARQDQDRIAIVADTLLSAYDMALPLTDSVLKFCCLPGYLCVCYSGSPELAAKSLFDFEQAYPNGTTFRLVVNFFEKSSSLTGNDYILAFGSTPKLVTIKDGLQVNSASKTHWIGDKKAYEKFREYEHRQRNRYEHGRAVNAAIFADEMKGSPASDLHGVMRNVILDPGVPSVGGFVTVIANRDIGWRYSAYSDILLDWPPNLPASATLQLKDKFDLKSSNENDRYSVSQISPGYYNMNIVAFYLLKGRLLIVLQGCHKGLPGQVNAIPNIEPLEIATTLNEMLGFEFGARLLVMSSREKFSLPFQRINRDDGIALTLYLRLTPSRRFSSRPYFEPPPQPIIYGVHYQFRRRPDRRYVWAIDSNLVQDQARVAIASVGSASRAALHYARRSTVSRWLSGHLRTLPCGLQLSDPDLSGMDGFFAAKVVRVG